LEVEDLDSDEEIVENLAYLFSIWFGG